MLTNFEQYTKELSKEEITLAYELRMLFVTQCRTQSNALKNKDIEHIFLKKGIKLGGAVRVRKLIHFLRVTALPNLCASSNGYWLEDDINELIKYNKSLTERINSIKEISEVVIKYVKDKQKQEAIKLQINLFTS